MVEAGTISAGWYADPNDPRMLRWWDGQGWTHDTTSAGASHQDPSGYAAPAYGAAGYGAPGYGGPGYGGAPAPTTNGLAIASLVLGIIGISVVAIVLGHVAGSQIKNSGGRQTGRGMAIAGCILGYLWLIITIGYIVLIAAVINDLSNDSYYGY